MQEPKSRAPEDGGGDAAWVALEAGGVVELSATLLSTVVTVTVEGAGHDAVEAISTARVGVGVTVTVTAVVHDEVLAGGGEDPAAELEDVLLPCPKGKVFAWDPFRTVF